MTSSLANPDGARISPPTLSAEAGALAAWFDEQSRGHHRALLEGDPVQVVTFALEALGQARTAA